MKRTIRMLFLLTLVILPALFFVIHSQQVLEQNKNGLAPLKMPMKPAARSVYAGFVSPK